MQEYIEFLDQMIVLQKKQLEAVLSKQVTVVEKSIASLQTFLLRLEGMEKKRMELQAQAGYGDMTFQQIIAQAPQVQKAELKELFENMEKKISDIGFYNEKSQEKVKLDLKQWGSQTGNQTATTYAAGYAANKKQMNAGHKSSLFETKA